MRIQINGEEREFPDSCSLAQILETVPQDLDRGVAVAINDAVVRRSEWSTRLIQDTDRILIICASQGG